MKIRKLYKSEKTVISFEIFPPDCEEKFSRLNNEITVLSSYTPAFFSLTCGASGKKNSYSKNILERLNTHVKTDIMPHFTCISCSKSEIDSRIEFLKSQKIENILALRGDFPENTNEICKEFCHANELVEYLKAKTDFSIAVAGYPEGHIESPSIKKDIENLKKKIDAGADAIFTQMFFINNKFFSYLENLENAGINVPVIAGIMPVISAKQLDKMTQLARITVPAALKDKIQTHAADKNYIKNLGIEFSTAQCKELLENKIKGLHFFTLNRAYSTSKILDNIL